MTPGKFLRLVWPSKGFYCVAHPFTPPGSAVTVYAHKVFSTISESVTYIHESKHSADVYFSVLSLREERVWDADKTDYKTGNKGAWAVRVQENIAYARSAFFDLDVGSEPAKYDTQRDALAGLVAFLKDTGLPMPTLVSSGGGVHVYWHFAEDVDVAEWRPLAWHLRQLAEGLKFKIDPMRTVDVTSVLRVPDTFNWKDRANPRPVKVLQEGAVTPFASFTKLVSDALIRHNITATEAPAPNRAAPVVTAPGLSSQTFNDFGPPPTLDELGAACAQVREIVRSQVDPAHSHYGALDNTAWYRGMLATISHVEDGENWCRKLTAMHPRTNSDTEAKLLQLKQFPPARCTTLQQFMPWKDTPCKSCRFLNDPSVPNPLAAARKATVAEPPKVDAAPPEIEAAPPLPPSAVTLLGLAAPSTTMMSLLIPNPPKPYERLKAGGIAVTRKDKDDNDSTTVIYPHDLFPLKRLVNAGAATEQQVWRVTLPRVGPKDFTIDADVLYDGRRFCSAMAHNGIYPNKADVSALQDYMVAYITLLQRSLDADTQLDHLGWTDGYRRFVLPDKSLLENGSVQPSALTEGAATSTQFLTKGGDLNEQVKLMEFYNHLDYVPNQSVILDAFASIIFYATGNHGIVVNMSGESGASKSTTLYTAAGVWGDPALWPINGTNRGATANARMQRIVTNANLPTPVDEITHLPVKEAIDLVMGITQPGHRLRLTTDGTEKRVAADNYKSAIMIASANSSLHALLSTDNAAGTAGSMRVFEMRFNAPQVHTKAEADEFLRKVRLHYGHLGEIFAQFVVRHRVEVEHRVQAVMREIDAAGRIVSSERFWSARVAVGIVAGEICKALRLLPYDVGPIRDWAINTQIPYMRGVVREEYREPLGVLTDYIAERHGNILVVDRATAIGANTAGQHVAADNSYSLNNLGGALLGHYDIKAGVLYLLKQGFKDHCSRIGASASRLLDELAQPRAVGASPPRRIVVERTTRRTLGAGTNLAKGQSWCFAVDMTHPEIAGAAPALAAQGGTPTSAPAGNLKVVK